MKEDVIKANAQAFKFRRMMCRISFFIIILIAILGTISLFDGVPLMNSPHAFNIWLSIFVGFGSIVAFYFLSVLLHDKVAMQNIKNLIQTVKEII